MGFENARVINLGNLSHWLPEVLINDKYIVIDPCLHVIFPLPEEERYAGLADISKNEEIRERVFHHLGVWHKKGEFPDYYKFLLENDHWEEEFQNFSDTKNLDFSLRSGEKIIYSVSLYYRLGDGGFSRSFPIHAKWSHAHRHRLPYRSSLLPNARQLGSAQKCHAFTPRLARCGGCYRRAVLSSIPSME
jgi:hypothetical protein